MQHLVKLFNDAIRSMKLKLFQSCNTKIILIEVLVWNDVTQKKAKYFIHFAKITGIESKRNEKRINQFCHCREKHDWNGRISNLRFYLHLTLQWSWSQLLNWTSSNKSQGVCHMAMQKPQCYLNVYETKGWTSSNMFQQTSFIASFFHSTSCLNFYSRNLKTKVLSFLCCFCLVLFAINSYNYELCK